MRTTATHNGDYLDGVSDASPAHAARAGSGLGQRRGPEPGGRQRRVPLALGDTYAIILTHPTSLWRAQVGRGYQSWRHS